jgi:hypothetical protein
MLAEVSTTKISEVEQPETFIGNRQVAQRGGGVAGTARTELEKQVGKTVITKDNYFTTPQNRKKLKK